MFIQKMSEAPGTENLPEEEKGRAMHAALPVGDGQFLMASDCLPSAGHVLKTGNKNYISLSGRILYYSRSHAECPAWMMLKVSLLFLFFC